ncbi:MAG: hypothetical protein QXD98_01615 [Candidatus Diapherotrites archaeon]
MRAQAAIEFVFIFALIGMIGTIIIGNWFSHDDDLYEVIGVRQSVVKALDSIDSNKFYLKKIDLRVLSCPVIGWNVSKTKVNVEVDPFPDSDMVDKIKGAVREGIFEHSGKSINVVVFVNDISGFFSEGCS